MVLTKKVVSVFVLRFHCAINGDKRIHRRHVNGRNWTVKISLQCKTKQTTSMAELKADLTDLEKKKVGDRVTICHELLTKCSLLLKVCKCLAKADQYLQFQNLWELLQQ
jgi:hypothetical protein